MLARYTELEIQLNNLLFSLCSAIENGFYSGAQSDKKQFATLQKSSWTLT